MSLRQMHAAWNIEDLDTYETIVLVVLADCANDQGNKCYPSVPFIMKRTKISERKVRSTIKSLEGKEYLRVIRGTGHVNSEYTLTLPAHLLKQWDDKRKKRLQARIVGHEEEKIVENHFDQLTGTDDPF